VSKRALLIFLQTTSLFFGLLLFIVKRTNKMERMLGNVVEECCCCLAVESEVGGGDRPTVHEDRRLRRSPIEVVAGPFAAHSLRQSIAYPPVSSSDGRSGALSMRRAESFDTERRQTGTVAVDQVLEPWMGKSTACPRDQGHRSPPASPVLGEWTAAVFIRNGSKEERDGHGCPARRRRCLFAGRKAVRSGSPRDPDQLRRVDVRGRTPPAGVPLPRKARPGISPGGISSCPTKVVMYETAERTGTEFGQIVAVCTGPMSRGGGRRIQTHPASSAPVCPDGDSRRCPGSHAAKRGSARPGARAASEEAIARKMVCGVGAK